jgi:hypothetical protein
MRGRFFLVLSVLTSRVPPVATPSWTPVQIALAAVSSVEVLADWGQTRDVLARGGHELNPVLGPHPTPERLAAYNAFAISGMLGVGALLAPQWRTVWFASVAVMEAVSVGRNAMLGFHVSF